MHKLVSRFLQCIRNPLVKELQFFYCPFCLVVINLHLIWISNIYRKNTHLFSPVSHFLGNGYPTVFNWNILYLAQKKINIMLLWKPALFSKINYQGFYCFSVACSQW